jgi:hypothetical protein
VAIAASQIAAVVVRDIFDTHQGPNMNGQAGYGVGGYTGIKDVFDGGGAGNSRSSGMGGGK